MSRYDATWRLRAVDPTLVTHLGEALGVSPLLARLLWGRGIRDLEAAHRFLGHAPYELDPWALPGVERAAMRLVQALKTDEPVVVYGDYDADGVTSTTLLFSYLARSGYNAHYFLPHRFQDGYGLNRHALEDLAHRGLKLIVTVDNGVASVDEVRYARELGMEVIVTDHHTAPAVLPEPYALVNPRLGGCPPEMAGLAGVGVAYVLAAALEALVPGTGIEDLQDLVAIGSIVDMVPLTGLNRTLVRRGLLRIATDPRPGLVAMADLAGIESLTAINPGDIGFRIGPRINAAGRMDSPEIGLKLFLAEDFSTAQDFALELERLNKLRQETSRRVEEEAMAMAAASFDPDRDGALILAKEDWHPGVIGIVASRMVEAYGRPAILLAGEGEDWTGSGRSPEPLNLFLALEASRDLLKRWGGHAQAAGMGLHRDQLEAFRSRLSEAVWAQGLAALPPAVRYVDAEIALAEVTPQVIRELELLQPTGMGNPEPVLGMRDVLVSRQRLRGKDRRHLFLEVQEGLQLREAVGFNLGSLHPVPERVSMAFTPEFNRFQGQLKLQLRLHAVRSADALWDTEPASAPAASGG